ncbi:unnamed protein product [Owenia fusiformis]|uniref:Uncharacterized protein n=1 Tax=Owenia fusiformis TaxID=6347 RepID=A0A8J1Y3T1_OWEFU|nr:unnamed protein product [Owenia fusiformis]
MKVLVLAAGYGTRLERDLKESTEYKHLIGVPKPLLPIGNKPLISHWYDTIEKTEEIDGVYVVTNAKNHKSFEEWAKGKANVELVCDGSTSNETRTGAVAAIGLTIEHFNINDSLIVIAGDTLFFDDFRLQGILESYKNIQGDQGAASMLVYTICSDDEVSKRGILETEGTRVCAFLEKPNPDNTESRKACPCFYVLHKESLPLVKQFLNEMKDLPLKSRDAPGNFISHLIQRHPVHAVEISGRYDVGGLQSYVTCHQHFLGRT